MRAIILTCNLLFLGLVYSLTSFSGLLITMATCGGLALLLVATSSQQGRSVRSRAASGGASTFIAPLTQF